MVKAFSLAVGSGGVSRSGICFHHIIFYNGKWSLVK